MRANRIAAMSCGAGVICAVCELAGLLATLDSLLFIAFGFGLFSILLGIPIAYAFYQSVPGNLAKIGVACTTLSALLWFFAIPAINKYRLRRAITRSDGKDARFHESR